MRTYQTILRQARPLAIVLVVTTAFAGCSEEQSIDLTPETLEKFAALEGMQQSTSEPLRRHYDLLVAEKTTPLDLRKPALTPEQNVAAVFDALFSKSFLSQQLEKSAEMFPRPRFDVDTKLLERIILFRRRLEPQRSKVAAALSRPQCDFGLDPARGWYADASILDAATVYVRLEAFLAAERLSENDLAAAADAVKRMFHMVGLLSNEMDVRARLLAGNLREEALSVLSATLHHMAADETTAREFYHVIENQLAHWPNDADAWIGDRARNLVSYEAVRKEALFTLLTEPELRRMMLNHRSKNLNATAAEGADSDQLFYLDEMQKILASCNKEEAEGRQPVPYFMRRHFFVDLVKAQQRKIEAGEFPLVAAEMFLPHMQQGHALQAADRARTEMWSLALAISLDMPPTKYELSPVSGQKYHVAAEPRNVVVTAYGNEDSSGNQSTAWSEAVVVPRFVNAAKRSARRP